MEAVPAAAPGQPLAQPRLPGLPYRVRAVTARSALQPCRFPSIPWSLNPYQGCAHACAFCYVPSLVHVEQASWGTYVLVKRNLPAVLAREVRHHRKALVALSTATDPYQAVEARCRVTRRCLEVLCRAGWPVSVLTRSPLVLRDLALLRSMDAEVGMSVPTLDDDARRALEPGAPGIPARLRCLRALRDAGVRTFASVAPLYPPTRGTMGDLAQALADAGVQRASAGSYRAYGDTWAGVSRAAARPGLEGLTGFRDPALQRRWLGELRRELAARGVPCPELAQA